MAQKKTEESAESTDVLKKLQEIDTSSVDELTEIQGEIEVLQGRLDKLDDKPGSASQEVVERIRSDYESRKSALEEKAAPLAKKARDQYSRLTEILSGVRQEAADLALKKEEVELRHQLGEFDDEEFDERLESLEASAGAHEKELAALEEVDALFAGALEGYADDSGGPTSDEAETPESTSAPTVDETPQPPAEPAAGDARDDDSRKEPADEAADETAEPAAAEEPAAPPPPPPPPPAPVESDQTEDEDEAETDEPPPQASEPEPDTAATEEKIADTSEPPAEPTEPADEEPAGTAAPTSAKTAMLTIGRLTPLDQGDEVQDILLGPLTSIGRTSDNDIEIAEPAVSRKHAEIEMTDQGFVVRDLDSGNGTFVNGEKVTEHVLADGDRIQIGTSRFQYVV